MKAKDFPSVNKKTPFSKKQIHLPLESHYSSLPVLKGGATGKIGRDSLSGNVGVGSGAMS